MAGALLSTVSACFNLLLLKFWIPDKNDGEPPPALLRLTGADIFIDGIGGGPLAFNVLRAGAVLLGGGTLPFILRGGPFVLRGGGKLFFGTLPGIGGGDGGGEFGPGIACCNNPLPLVLKSCLVSEASLGVRSTVAFLLEASSEHAPCLHF